MKKQLSQMCKNITKFLKESDENIAIYIYDYDNSIYNLDVCFNELEQERIFQYPFGKIEDLCKLDEKINDMKISYLLYINNKQYNNISDYISIKIKGD
jgi:hypothetical protein